MLEPHGELESVEFAILLRNNRRTMSSARSGRKSGGGSVISVGKIGNVCGFSPIRDTSITLSGLFFDSN